MDNKKFWTIAYNEGWATLDEVMAFVKTESNLKGEITKEDFKEITKKDFDVLEKPVEASVNNTQGGDITATTATDIKVN